MESQAPFTRPELITQIIRNDLIFNRLLGGITDLSFDTYNQDLNLPPAINFLLGITDPQLCAKFSEFYFKMTEKLKHVHRSDFHDVFLKRAGHVTTQLVRKESFLINKKKERSYRINCASEILEPDLWDNDRLVMHLIKSDLIHRRVLHGFSKLGFDTWDYQLNLDECAMWFMGIWNKDHQREIKKEYSAIADKVKNIGLTSTNDEIGKLSAEIYHRIQATCSKSRLSQSHEAFVNQ